MGADDDERKREKKDKKKKKKKRRSESESGGDGEGEKKKSRKKKSKRKEREQEVNVAAAEEASSDDDAQGVPMQQGETERLKNAEMIEGSTNDDDVPGDGRKSGRVDADDNDDEAPDSGGAEGNDDTDDGNRIDKDGGEDDNAGDDEQQQHQQQSEDQQEPSSKRKRKRKRKKKDAPGGSGGGGGEGPGLTGAGQEEKLTSIEHTVYVEGVPFDCSEEDVRKFFDDNGCGDVLQMRMPRWQDSGRLRGYGHIVFDTVTSRAKALKELNGLNLGRRYLTIREPNAPKPGTTAAAATGCVARSQPDECRTVFVKNLPYESSEEDLTEAFRPCGKIVDGGVRLARNYVTKQCKGFAYVEFKNPEGAYAAVQRAAKPFGLAVKGRPCFVDYDEGKMKGSYRTEEGKLWQREHGSVHATAGEGEK